MNALSRTLLLALAWVALRGELTPFVFAEGIAIGYVVLVAARQAPPPRWQRLRAWIALWAYFVWDLVLSNARVAIEVLTPNDDLRCGVVAVPLDTTSDASTTMLATLINLTPGAVSLDVSDDRRTLYVHTMHLTSAEAFRRHLKGGLERRVKEAIER